MYLGVPMHTPRYDTVVFVMANTPWIIWILIMRWQGGRGMQSERSNAYIGHWDDLGLD